LARVVYPCLRCIFEVTQGSGRLRCRRLAQRRAIMPIGVWFLGWFTNLPIMYYCPRLNRSVSALMIFSLWKTVKCFVLVSLYSHIDGVMPPSVHVVNVNGKIQKAGWEGVHLQVSSFISLLVNGNLWIYPNSSQISYGL